MGAFGLLYLKEEILDSWKVNQTYCNKYGQKNASACSQYIYLRNFNEKIICTIFTIIAGIT